MGYFNEKLSRAAYHLGGFIAVYPKSFLFTFAVLSFSLSLGISRYKYVNDVDYLFTVTNGQSKQDRATIEEFFPFNASQRFDISRFTRLGRFVRVIIQEKHEENLLQTKVWRDIQDLDRQIRNVSIEWGNADYNYNDICVKWFDDCYLNEFLEIGDDVLPEFEKGKTRISYPVLFHLKTYKTYPLAQYLGGVNLSTDGNSLHSATTMMLNYFLADDDTNDNERGLKWEESVFKLASKWDQSSSQLKVYKFALHSIPNEIDNNIISSTIPFIGALIVVVIYILFSTTSYTDWVKSKPMLGIMGCISGVLGMLASVGILCYFEIPLIGLAMGVPFLMLAIGIDDTFVMLSVWRTTSPHDPVPKRMADCYSEAVVSVTITSLTDMFSFYVGIFTPIPCIQIFSMYAGTGVLCIFIWQIFFFGACMAISGYYEAENRHSIFFWMKAIPRSKSGDLSGLKRFLFIGGVDPSDQGNQENLYVDTTSLFFRDVLAPLLCKKWVQSIVMLTFVAYLCVATYGMTQIQEGLEMQRLARYDSYMAEFFNINDKYFNVYSYRVQVIIANPLDYSVESNRIKVNRLLDTIIDDPNISDEFNENWLNSFTSFVERYKDLVDYNISNESSFIKTLREEYLKETSPLSTDVVFNEDHTKIIASRFILQSKNVLSIDIGKEALIRLRQMCQDFQSEGLDVKVYNPWFLFVDQFLIIREVTYKLLLIAILIVMIVTALLIPNFICCLCVFFSILSIQFGVVGFMALWGINLDIVSVVCIVMCVGFSVDFSAHVSYAYVASTANNPEDKIRDCLFALGKPVFQGAVSTILAMGPLLTIPSYIFQSDCKICFLIIVFAMAHALVLLPVLLSVFKPVSFIPVPWKTSKTYHIGKEKGIEINHIDKYIHSVKSLETKSGKEYYN